MLRLHSCGYHYVHPEGITILRPQGAGNYAFVLFKSQSQVRLGGSVIPAGPGDFILYRPDTPQHYLGVTAPFVNDWFHCECDDGFFRETRFPLDRVLPAPDPVQASRRILELQAVSLQGGPDREPLLDADLRSLLLRLASGGPGSEAARGGRHAPRLVQLRTELYNSPGQPITVEELARRLDLSRSHFQQLYRSMFGVPVMADIINSRLEYAKYLLRSGTVSVADTARLCGYENDVHFIRQFKRAVGVTPGRYRMGEEGVGPAALR